MAELIARANHFIIKTTAVIVLGFVSFASCHAGPDNIRVGAWNIETLGTPKNRDYPKKRESHGFGVSRNAPGLAAEIRKLDLDVLVVLEIDVSSRESTRSNKLLDGTLRILNGASGHDWNYVLFPKYSYYERSQLTGIAWNRARISQLGTWHRVDLGERTSQYWERD